MQDVDGWIVTWVVWHSYMKMVASPVVWLNIFHSYMLEEQTEAWFRNHHLHQLALRGTETKLTFKNECFQLDIETEFNDGFA